MSGLALAGSALLTPIVGPIASIVAFVQDRRARSGRFRQTRIVALIASLVTIDFVGRIVVFGIWLQGPVGLNRTSPRIQNKYSSVMTWYTTKIMSIISTIAPLPIDTSELDDALLGGNAVVIGRHRSVFDAVLPAAIFGRLGLTTLYVLKDELQWDPNLDVVGHRMGHVFVDRTAKDREGELTRIRELAARIDEYSIGVIFPEGTFFSETRLERAVKAIERRSPQRAAKAAQLRHMLPPRPAGMLAMLEGAPDADVIVLGHVGVEPFGSIPQILENLGDKRQRLRLKAWRFDRSTIPTDTEAQIDWIDQRWLEMDEWISRHHPLPGTAPKNTESPN